MNTIGISVISNRTHITLLAEDILYLSLNGRKTAIHITGDRIYETYTPIDELAKKLGSTFIRVDRCCLVSAKAIHDVTKTIDLINGESLDYARRRKREIVEQLIDHSFGSIFPNMDAKWLRVYEHTALYGETLEITDYSPEIDTELKIICFPTFPGHCGCMLFDRRTIQTVQGGREENGLTTPFEKQP